MTKHKFYEELCELEKGKLSGEYNLLIIGTFNPERLYDKKTGKLIENPAKWYYGRPKSEFWFLLPKALGHHSLHAADNFNKYNDRELERQWREFCKTNKIIIVDMIKSLKTPVSDYKDSTLAALSLNEIIEFDFKGAFQNISFKKAAFTQQSGTGSIRKLRRETKKLLDELNIKDSIDLMSPSSRYQESRLDKLIDWTNKLSDVKTRGI